MLNRFYQLHNGDIFHYIGNIKDIQSYIDSGIIAIIKTYYAKKPWYCFWKRKSPIAYDIVVVGLETL